MTETILTRTDTGTHAVVRVVDPDVPVSAPYSRAVGHLERWVRDERRAVDEFSAWIEGQAAQAAAEMRTLCDELELPIAWAVADPLPPVLAGIRGRYGTIGEPSPYDPNPPTGRPVHYDKDRVQAYFDADDPDDRPGRVAWVNVDGEPGVMPARIVPVALPPRNDMFAGRFVPDPAEYGIPAVEPDHGPIDRWLRRAEDRITAWWRAKQAQRDKRMGVEQ